MSLYDDIRLLLGSFTSDYPFLAAFVTCIVFCYLLINILNIFNALFKYIGGIR